MTTRKYTRYKGNYIDRFWVRVDKKSSKECWNWIGFITRDGYGQFHCVDDNNIKYFRAHRLSYVLAGGTLDPKLCLDHTCRNRACMNPNHLEQVSLKENLNRGEGICAKRKRSEKCKNGHSYKLSQQSNYMKKNEWRSCKICRNKWENQWRQLYRKRRKLETATID